jgi:hypothetical protein
MLNSLLVAKDVTDAQTTSNGWLSAPQIGAAVITAVFTIFGILLKDFVFKRIDERRSDRRLRISIYERYSNPLVTSSISLLRRLHEILYQEQRPVYLRGQGISSSPNHGSVFRAYKKRSTVYRLAVVLGWIRACRREFSYLRVADPGDARQIDEAINDFENALADGSWVEQEKVRRLCELWHLSDAEKVRNDAGIEGLGAKVYNLILDHLEAAKLDDVSFLDETSKLTLCRTIADCLSAYFRTNTVSVLSMERTWPDAFSIIGMREAWVYRDWQSSIGDIMIQPSQADTRKFEVIGFGPFEQMMLEGSEQQQFALSRLLEVFDDLDLSIEDRFDSRPRQIRAIAKASAQLILAIDTVQGRESIIPAFSAEMARKVIRMSQTESAIVQKFN